MAAEIRPGEITDILKREIKEYGRDIDIAEPLNQQVALELENTCHCGVHGLIRIKLHGVGFIKEGVSKE